MDTYKRQRYNTVIRKELVHNGFTLTVTKDFIATCKVCRTEIPNGHDFYYCEQTGKKWCYKCRTQEWINKWLQYGEFKVCELTDNHEHIHIVGIKFEV